MTELIFLQGLVSGVGIMFLYKLIVLDIYELKKDKTKEKGRK